MRSFHPPLPVDDVLDELAATLKRHAALVFVAPPGAGKSTRVPLALLDEEWARDRKIIMLEPRRIAARAAAEQMARVLSEKVGETVGYRVRFGSKISARTRIEVVTEGIFTRQILSDPELNGVAAVVFDEFHERSLDADLGLALTRDAQIGLREDLRMIVMSATLDGVRVSQLLGDAPIISSEGRAFPVETRYLGRRPDAPLERQMADAIVSALRQETGSILAFLPGTGEIRRVESQLAERVTDPAVEIVPLYGALDAAVQDRAIAPTSPGKRKIVLATSIAETSLTIEGVRVVVDCGLSRVPRYEPDIGITRLETVRASRAAIDQRRGRAGRTEAGVCYRLWDEPQNASLDAFTRPEILSADLSSFVLDLAQWGVNDPSALTFLDPPPVPALNEARKLLRDIGAIDEEARISGEGRRLRDLPLPPRLARMIVDAHRAEAGLLAAEIAVLLSERGLGGDAVDLAHRLDNFRRERGARAQAAREMAMRWARQVASGESAGHAHEKILSPGVILSLAFPDRIARRRAPGSFVMANGRGASLDLASPLSRAPFLAIGELAGAANNARILLCAEILIEDIEQHFVAQIVQDDDVSFDPAAMSLRARRRKRLGSLVLHEQPIALQADLQSASILANGLIERGLHHLPWSKALKQWRDRVMFLRAAEGDEWPDLSDAGLASSLDDWLVPLLAHKTSLAQISASELSDAIMTLLPWHLRRRLDDEAPTHFEAPTGSLIPIDYEAEEGPKVAVRVQELFGLTRHPAIAAGKVPLVLELLSPAHRPVQVTRDLPGFWSGSYASVRADMRGRYPKHPWPDDPANAPPTRRAKTSRPS